MILVSGFWINDPGHADSAGHKDKDYCFVCSDVLDDVCEEQAAGVLRFSNSTQPIREHPEFDSKLAPHRHSEGHAFGIAFDDCRASRTPVLGGLESGIKQVLGRKF